MKKYEIMTDSAEILRSKSIRSFPAMSAGEVFDTYRSLTVQEPRCEGSYDTLEEANAVWQALYAKSGRTYAQAGNPFAVMIAEVAWIEENEYDDDGEYDQGGNVWRWSADGYNDELEG